MKQEIKETAGFTTDELYRKIRMGNSVERYERATISQTTRAALLVKAHIQDALASLFYIHELVCGTFPDDERYNEICRSMEKAESLANDYLLASMDNNLGILTSSEF